AESLLDPGTQRGGTAVQGQDETTSRARLQVERSSLDRLAGGENQRRRAGTAGEIGDLQETALGSLAIGSGAVDDRNSLARLAEGPPPNPSFLRLTLRLLTGDNEQQRQLAADLRGQRQRFVHGRGYRPAMPSLEQTVQLRVRLHRFAEKHRPLSGKDEAHGWIATAANFFAQGRDGTAAGRAIPAREH